MRRYKVIILASLILTSDPVAPLSAQSFPDDLASISPDAVPSGVCNYISMADWGSGLPFWPADTFGDVQLYYSQTFNDALGVFVVFADNRESEAARLLSRAAGLMTEDSDSGYQLDGVDYSTNHTDLILDIIAVTNSVIEGTTNKQALLSIRNTTNAICYEILSSLSVSNPMSAWISEGVWIGRSSNTLANVPIGGRTNQNFFRAKVFNGFSNGIPTNGQLFLVLSSNTPIQGIVNGATNTLTNFYGNYAMARLPNTNGDILQTYYLNLGYSHDDGGTTNTSDFPAQNLTGLLGFSKTVSNLCLTSNLLSELNVSGWPALYDLECWHCTNMLRASITNCPKLNRVCLEAIQGNRDIGITNKLDFSGCTNVAEIRAADNRFPDILFGNGAGPQVWHFCVHDNSSNSLPANYDFTRFPSMRELWIWANYFTGPLTLTTAQATNLTSVEAFNNYFTSANFSGQTNLDHVWIYNMATLTNLNIGGCTKLLSIRAYNDSLPRGVVDSVLSSLDQLGLLNGQVLLTNNGAPSNVGLTAADHLRSKGWSVEVAPGSPVISNITADASSNSATITWTTDIPADSVVYYGTNTSYGWLATGNSNTAHSVSLTGLLANTDYHFYVTSTSGTSTSYSGDTLFDTRPPPQPIYFISSSSSVFMHAVLSGGGTATWVWGGVVTNTSDSHSFGSTGIRTNSVTFNPASALIEFGISCESSSTTLTSVGGLTNYPNLQDIFFFQTGLTNISLAGCSNLVHIALAACNPTPETEDRWFDELAAAQQTLASGTSAYCDGAQNYFFYPASPGPTSASTTSSNHLYSIHWHLYPY